MTKTLQDIVNEFVDAVMTQDSATKSQDVRAGNRQAERYWDCFQQLRSRGDVGRDALGILLDDPREPVRVTAAGFLLRHNYGKARWILERAAAQEGIWAFQASQCLQRWDAGEWALDPKD